jgi:hypothetical protein
MDRNSLKGNTNILTGLKRCNFQDAKAGSGRRSWQTERQQMVIKAILDKVLTMGTVVNYKNILALWRTMSN